MFGGGLELSLACHYRICSTDKSTQLGLPGSAIRILPGGRNTKIAPHQVLLQLLDLILTGKKVDGKSFKLGLVDDLVPENQLLDKAIALCKQNKSKKKIFASLGMVSSMQGHFDFAKVSLEGNPFGLF